MVLMTRYRAAAILMLIHGALMEVGTAIAVIPLVLLRVDAATVGEHFSFIVPYLQENLYLMMVMSGIFGALRVIGAIGVLRNRLWGLVLALANCVVTLALMIFLLPAGIVDGVLAGGALILLLQGWLGSAPILPRPAGRRP